MSRYEKHSRLALHLALSDLDATADYVFKLNGSLDEHLMSNVKGLYEMKESSLESFGQDYNSLNGASG